jgi:hypothetical protein
MKRLTLKAIGRNLGKINAGAKLCPLGGAIRKPEVVGEQNFGRVDANGRIWGSKGRNFDRSIRNQDAKPSFNPDSAIKN